jgi:hypothetical protein
MEAYMLDINPEKHLEAIKSSSKTAMHEVYASHMLSDSTFLLAGGHDKVVFAKMLRAQHAQCGSMRQGSLVV